MNPWIDTLDSYLPVWMPSWLLAFTIMFGGIALVDIGGKMSNDTWGTRLFGLGWIIAFAGGGLGLLCGLIF